MTAPCAFISHANRDKERIARPLDAGLRNRGIGTWLDERDMLPGDKLVRKIFREGITGSDGFIVVLSQYSSGSRWLRDELDAAVVHRINGAVKTIIPVVLDRVTVPFELAATVWETISDLSNLEPHFDRCRFRGSASADRAAATLCESAGSSHPWAHPGGRSRFCAYRRGDTGAG